MYYQALEVGVSQPMTTTVQDIDLKENPTLTWATSTQHKVIGGVVPLDALP
jgi:hypothetical protein